MADAPALGAGGETHESSTLSSDTTSLGKSKTPRTGRFLSKKLPFHRNFSFLVSVYLGHLYSQDSFF